MLPVLTRYSGLGLRKYAQILLLCNYDLILEKPLQDHILCWGTLLQRIVFLLSECLVRVLLSWSHFNHNVVRNHSLARPLSPQHM